MDRIPDVLFTSPHGTLWCMLGVDSLICLRHTCSRMAQLITRAAPVVSSYSIHDESSQQRVWAAITTSTVWSRLHILNISIGCSIDIGAVLGVIGQLPELAQLRVCRSEGVFRGFFPMGGGVLTTSGGLIPPPIHAPTSSIFPRLLKWSVSFGVPADCIHVAELLLLAGGDGAIMPCLENLTLDCSSLMVPAMVPVGPLVARLVDGLYNLRYLHTLTLDTSMLQNWDFIGLLRTLQVPQSLQHFSLIAERSSLVCQNVGKSIEHTTMIGVFWLSLNDTALSATDIKDISLIVLCRMPRLVDWQLGVRGCGLTEGTVVSILEELPSTMRVFGLGIAGDSGLSCPNIVRSIVRAAMVRVKNHFYLDFGVVNDPVPIVSGALQALLCFTRTPQPGVDLRFGDFRPGSVVCVCQPLPVLTPLARIHVPVGTPCFIKTPINDHEVVTVLADGPPFPLTRPLSPVCVLMPR
jgi:hypothetical protein